MHDSDRDSDVPPYFRVGDFLIRPTLKSVRPFRGFEVVSSIAEDRGLTDKAMAVLLYLADRPREVCLREQLLDTVWGEDREAYDRVLDNAISEIRRAFGDDPRSPRYVQTIPKQGYRLIAEVERPQPHFAEPTADTSTATQRRRTTRRQEPEPTVENRPGVSRRGLWVALGSFVVLLALGVWRWSIDDRIRVVVEIPQVEAEVTDPTTFSSWLEEALAEASRCSMTVQRRRLSWLSRFTLGSALRREADGELSLNLWLSDRGAKPVVIESRSWRDDPALGGLIDDAAGQVARAIDLAICRSGEPRGVERACHCREAGSALSDRRQWNDARKALEKAIDLASDDWLAYDRLANLEQILGFDEQALHWAERGLETVEAGSEPDLRLRRRRAQILGEVGEEAALLDALEALDPDNESVQLAMGWFTAVHERRCRGSLDRLNAAADGGSAVVYAYLGYTWLTCGEVEDAITAFEHYRRLEPNTVDAYDSMAWVYRLTGRYREAAAELKRAREIDSNFAAEQLHRGHLALAEGRLSRARQDYLLFGQAFRWPAARAQTHLGLARVARQLGELDEAMRQADEALAIQPDLVEALWVRGLAALAGGDVAVARQHAETIRTLRAGHGSAWGMEYHHHLMARLALAEGRTRDAVDEMLFAVDLRPLDWAFFIAELAEARRVDGQLDAAEEDYEKALAFNPRHRRALCGLAALAEADGRRREALGHYDRFDRSLDRPESLLDRDCFERRRRLSAGHRRSR